MPINYVPASVKYFIAIILLNFRTFNIHFFCNIYHDSSVFLVYFDVNFLFVLITNASLRLSFRFILSLVGRLHWLCGVLKSPSGLGCSVQSAVRVLLRAEGF